MTKTTSPSLTGNQLKILACIAMIADHVVKSWYVRGLPAVLLSSVLGRIAFPIYCFFITEGFFHTRNRTKYLLRMVVFAAISEIPFNLGLHHTLIYKTTLCTLWSLSLGLLLFNCLAFVEKKRELHIAVSWILRLLLVAVFAVAAHYLHVDYRERGLLCMAVLYFLRNERPHSVPVLWACLPLNMKHFSNPGSFLAALPLHFYNGERGRLKLKYFFYAFYPLHLIFIYIAGKIILR